MNEAGLKILGFKSKEKLLSQKMPDYYCDPKEHERFVSELWDKGSISNFRHEILRGDGKPTSVLVNAGLVAGDQDEPLVIQGTMIDITEMLRNRPELTVDL
jgi:PAS domain S-box-containing protein